MSTQDNFSLMDELSLTPGLPSGWSTVEVGELVDLVNGYAFKPRDWSKTGRPIIRIQNLNNPHASYNYFDGELPSKFLVRRGDLLFAWSGTPGTSFGAHVWIGEEAWLNQHIFKIGFNEEYLDKEFLRLAINQNLEEYVRAAHGGAGLAHITKGVFERSLLPIPPLAEQRRIVAEIETQFTRIDAAVAALERVQTALRSFEFSVLAASADGSLLGCDSDQWPTATLGELTERAEYGTSVKCSYERTGVPVLRIPNVVRGRLDLEDLKFATQSLDLKPGDELSRGDLLVIRTNGSVRLVGRSAVVDTSLKEPHSFASYLLRFRFKPSLVDAMWIHYWLASPLTRRFIEASAASSAGQHNVNLSLLKQMVLRLPPLDLQKQIAVEVHRRLSFASQVETDVIRSLNRAERLRQAILQQAFDGQLVPQDPDDEPSTILLERIQSDRETVANGRSRTRRRGRRPSLETQHALF